ncbi:histidine kinase dimerization/phospho-acceptor domain-containing protein [Evansella sp. AB-rgal1]|uniref:HAMP domain-containing sensor histidine kinase n=1 Tax=Evansella sp. AB-rgal1 TaxID=3242696 RepID=UPI00359F0DB2
MIVCSMLILPIAFPLASFVTYLPAIIFKDDIITYNSTEIASLWHEAAEQLSSPMQEEIIHTLENWEEMYEEASMFWVDEWGRTRFKTDPSLPIPELWNPSYTVSFMKDSYGGDPFTVVAFIGSTKDDGFLVLQIPRVFMDYPIRQLEEYYQYIYLGMVALVLLVFISLSWFFFKRIRKRIVQLQVSMDVKDKGIPSRVKVGEKDEIGALEESFNNMIHQLEEGRLREQEEEQLRKELIANLSHDLRTPLASIRAHTFSLGEEEKLSSKGKQSVAIIDKKIDYLHNLIENLLSYTLLTSGKYTYCPRDIDINRAIRMSLTAWYPIFEKEKFTIDIQLHEQTVYWEIDPNWFERILDNVFQNVVRHALSGKYIGVLFDGKTISIIDKGQGMKEESFNAGVGIGLSIVHIMAKEMKISWEIKSSNTGTIITLTKE